MFHSYCPNISFWVNKIGLLYYFITDEEWWQDTECFPIANVLNLLTIQWMVCVLFWILYFAWFILNIVYVPIQRIDSRVIDMFMELLVRVALYFTQPFDHYVLANVAMPFILKWLAWHVHCNSRQCKHVHVLVTPLYESSVAWPGWIASLLIPWYGIAPPGLEEETKMSPACFMKHDKAKWIWMCFPPFYCRQVLKVVHQLEY